MKKKVIIFRFGSAMPTQKEFELMHTITGGTREATGCSTPFGVISIVNTEMTPSQVTRLFNLVADEHGDALPTIVFEANKSVGFNFHPEFFEHFEECNREFDESFGNGPYRCTLSLDELLDLVKAKGLDNFTDVELKRLKELSR
jgi:hypothetical protein